MKILVNMERCRWREADSPARHKKYVLVNIPSFHLYAIDEQDTLAMKIGCGSTKTKTPILNSYIKRMDLNPKWFVPRSIMVKDMVHHAGNPAYVNARNYYISDRSTGEEVNPAQVTRTMLLSGKESFIELFKTCFYLPMPFKYIYNRKYLHKIQARFEEGIMHEDELWCPIVLCQAERMVITNIEFYYYRQNEESVMHTTSLARRLKSLFQVTEGLIKFSDQFVSSKTSVDLRSWWYVNILRLYSKAFTLLPNIKDSSYIVHKHYLDRFWRDCGQMIPESIQRCRNYYYKAEAGLKEYTDWRVSDWVAGVDCQIKAGKKVMLVFNTINGEDLQLKIEDVPVDWVITTDRKYFQQATIVVFHLPTLHYELENDQDKLEGQTWVSWHLESEKDDPGINDPEISELFDLLISDPQDSEGEQHPLLRLCRNYVNNG